MTEGKQMEKKESRWIWWMHNNTLGKAQPKRKQGNITATPQELHPQSQWGQEVGEASGTLESGVLQLLSEEENQSVSLFSSNGAKQWAVAVGCHDKVLNVGWLWGSLCTISDLQEGHGAGSRSLATNSPTKTCSALCPQVPVVTVRERQRHFKESNSDSGI